MNPSAHFQTPIKVRFPDVDGAGIVYYPRFFDFCHQAFEDLFDLHGPCSYSCLITEQKHGFPTVAIQSQFRRPLLYGDVAKVTLTLEHVGLSSLRIAYTIHQNDNGILSFEATITSVYMDLNQRKSVPFPLEIREFLERVRCLTN